MVELNILKDSGFCLNVFLTPQEHLMLGSTVDNKYHEKWYTPMLVQDGISVATVNEIRQYICDFFSFLVYEAKRDNLVFEVRPYNIKDNDFNLEAKLAPLGKDGETLYDPQPLDERLKFATKEHAEYKLRPHLKP